MALRQLTRTLRVARSRPCPRLLPVPRTAAPAGSRPFASYQNRSNKDLGKVLERSNRDFGKELEQWRAERLKAARDDLKESRLETACEIISGVFVSVGVAAGLALVVFASGAVGFVLGLPFGAIMFLELLTDAIKKGNNEKSEMAMLQRVLQRMAETQKKSQAAKEKRSTPTNS